MKKLDIGQIRHHHLRLLQLKIDLTTSLIRKKNIDHHLNHQVDGHLIRTTPLQVLIKNDINLIIIL